jgi:Icc protein
VSVLKLTQITDLHLGSTADYQLRGHNTLASLRSVLQAIECNGRGEDLLLITGDLASDSQLGAYQQLDQLLNENSKRALWLPGNHDDVDAMREKLVHYPQITVYESGNWAILTVDSSQEGKPGGRIADWQLQQLESNLNQLADKFVLVAMHHSPVLVNSLWLDQHRIANQLQLYDLLQSHGNVKAVVNGHVHQQCDSDWDGLAVYSTPSTCTQFQPLSDHFALSSQPPAYRWFDLHANGHIDTGVQFVQQVDGQ